MNLGISFLYSTFFVQIFNNEGKLILKKILSEKDNTINLSNQANGVYVITFNNSSCIKIIKK